MQVFDHEEIELIIGGTPFIDVQDWKENTIYSGELNPEHSLIVSFWSILETLSQEELRKFLVFCTGMPRVPIDGFK